MSKLLTEESMKPIRQGDVLLVPIEELPKGQVTRHVQLTLAYGGATGHHHTLYPFGGSSVGQDALADTSNAEVVEEIIINGKRFIKLDVEWFLRHQEHKELRIPPACYEIVIEREYSPFEKMLKTVID